MTSAAATSHVELHSANNVEMKNQGLLTNYIPDATCAGAGVSLGSCGKTNNVSNERSRSVGKTDSAQTILSCAEEDSICTFQDHCALRKSNDNEEEDTTVTAASTTNRSETTCPNNNGSNNNNKSNAGTRYDVSTISGTAEGAIQPRADSARAPTPIARSPAFNLGKKVHNAPLELQPNGDGLQSRHASIAQKNAFHKMYSMPDMTLPSDLLTDPGSVPLVPAISSCADSRERVRNDANAKPPSNIREKSPSRRMSGSAVRESSFSINDFAPAPPALRSAGILRPDQSQDSTAYENSTDMSDLLGLDDHGEAVDPSYQSRTSINSSSEVSDITPNTSIENHANHAFNPVNKNVSYISNGLGMHDSGVSVPHVNSFMTSNSAIQGDSIANNNSTVFNESIKIGSRWIQNMEGPPSQPLKSTSLRGFMFGNDSFVREEKDEQRTFCRVSSMTMPQRPARISSFNHTNHSQETTRQAGGVIRGGSEELTTTTEATPALESVVDSSYLDGVSEDQCYEHPVDDRFDNTSDPSSDPRMDPVLNPTIKHAHMNRRYSPMRLPLDPLIESIHSHAASTMEPPGMEFSMDPRMETIMDPRSCINPRMRGGHLDPRYYSLGYSGIDPSMMPLHFGAGMDPRMHPARDPRNYHSVPVDPRMDPRMDPRYGGGYQYPPPMNWAYPPPVGSPLPPLPSYRSSHGTVYQSPYWQQQTDAAPVSSRTLQFHHDARSVYDLDDQSVYSRTSNDTNSIKASRRGSGEECSNRDLARYYGANNMYPDAMMTGPPGLPRDSFHQIPPSQDYWDGQPRPPRSGRRLSLGSPGPFEGGSLPARNQGLSSHDSLPSLNTLRDMKDQMSSRIEDESSKKSKKKSWKIARILGISSKKSKSKVKTGSNILLPSSSHVRRNSLEHSPKAPPATKPFSSSPSAPSGSSTWFRKKTSSVSDDEESFAGGGSVTRL